MSKVNSAYVALNAGEIGPEVIQRTSLETYPNTASRLENWMPEVAGPAMFRPGLAFCGRIDGDPRSYIRRFTFNMDHTYLMWFSPNELRFVRDCEVEGRDDTTTEFVFGPGGGLTLTAPDPNDYDPEGHGPGGPSGDGGGGGSDGDGVGDSVGDSDADADTDTDTDTDTDSDADADADADTGGADTGGADTGGADTGGGI